MRRSTALVVGIVVVRMLFMPLCGLLAVHTLRSLGATLIEPFLSVDPFWLSCLIVTCTPTANNIVVLCELAGENKHMMSAAIFYQYCAAPIILPFVLTIFVASICQFGSGFANAPGSVQSVQGSNIEGFSLGLGR